MTQIPYREGADFPKLPTQTPVLVRVAEVKFVNEKNPFFGKAGKDNKVDNREFRDMVKVVMEAAEEELAGAKVWDNFGASIHESSKLRPFINSCNERDLTTDELKKFNVEDLKNRYVQVFGTYAETDPKQQYLRPTGYLRATKAQIKAAESSERSQVRQAIDAAKVEQAAKAALAGTAIDF